MSYVLSNAFLFFFHNSSFSVSYCVIMYFVLFFISWVWGWLWLEQDYFDVIDTPMDFGTICNHLQNGTKYMNSEDVFRDVQYIWKNCCTYYNEGNFVLDLMKRVKEKFMTYWTEAGLCSKEPGPRSGKGFTLLLFC